MSWRTFIARLELALYPELQGLAARERASARAQAAQEPLDYLEWGGILIGIVVATGLTRYSSDGMGASERLAALMLNFVIAVPILAAIVGPFLVRRTRRGLARISRAKLTQG